MPRKPASAYHERLDLKKWIKTFPLEEMREKAAREQKLTGPSAIAYIEQMRLAAKRKRRQLGTPTAVDLCVWKYGDTSCREGTKIGGIPYWPVGGLWPFDEDENFYTFVAQICFADSRDIVGKLPGDILVILAGSSDYQTIALRWFKLGEDLVPAERIPAGQWPIQPCHAVLHRTVEYSGGDYTVFDDYPYPISLWAKRFLDGTKIGGVWALRGDMPRPSVHDGPKVQADLRRAWRGVKTSEKQFTGQLGSMQVTRRQPFLNVARYRTPSSKLLMISDVGGFDFFSNGRSSRHEWWSG